MWLARPIALFAAAPETQQNTLANVKIFAVRHPEEMRQLQRNSLFTKFTHLHDRLSVVFPFSLPLLASSSSPLLLDGSSIPVWLIIRPADRTIIRFRQKESPFFSPVVIQLVAVQFILDQFFFVKSFYCLFAITGYVDKLHFCNLATQMTK